MREIALDSRFVKAAKGQEFCTKVWAPKNSTLYIGRLKVLQVMNRRLLQWKTTRAKDLVHVYACK